MVEALSFVFALLVVLCIAGIGIGAKWGRELNESNKKWVRVLSTPLVPEGLVGMGALGILALIALVILGLVGIFL